MTGRRSGQPFGGFHPLTSNTTYTPNQLFDVCLRHSSQSAFRLVAYMIRRTLGWVDHDGKPQESRPSAGYAELVSRAGISRNRARAAIDEAVAAGFIRLHRAGVMATPGVPGSAALYELAWDPRPEYRKHPENFRGFYEGEGNRTDVPNDYFDHVVANEPLSVSKVVGAVLRFSIGFQARKGSRRQHVALSLTDIARYTRISSRRTLSEALQTALEKRYIVRLSEGAFSPRREDRRKAVYGLCWADGWVAAPDTSGQSQKDTSAFRIPAGTSLMDTSGGAEGTPAERCDLDTNLEIPIKNETTKPAAAPSELAGLLLEEGVGRRNAERIARDYDEAAIRRQLEWLDFRSASKSRAGLLVRAIEGDWAKPLRLATHSSGHTRSLNRDEVREEHKNGHLDSYLEYLRAEEQRIIEAHPAEYAGFLDTRKTMRAKFAASEKPWHNQAFLRRFDADRARLKALMERFELLPFWEWDASRNPEGLRETIQY